MRRFLFILFLSSVIYHLSSNLVSAQTTCPTPYPLRSYYISPSGNDANSGISQASPIRTFSKAWQLLCPGDTLYLMDGTYFQSLDPPISGTPNPEINTSDYQTYPLDHPERMKYYVKIKALNDGQAIIDGQSNRVPINLGEWRNYYLIEGIVAKNSSENVIYIQAKNVTLRRCSGFNSNTHDNTGVFEIWSSGDPSDPANILLEDNFASGLGRKMIMAYATYVNVVFRSNTAYIYNVPLCDWACQNDWPNGDGIEIYNWNQPDVNNNSIVENNLFLGGGPTYGFSLTPNPARTIGNKYLGMSPFRTG